MQQRIILHIDLDYFYAQVEEILKPELKGKPVVVGADPKGGRGRGVVSTCNYEARKFDIRSGMPISIAYRKCHDCVFLPVRMDLYVEFSSRVMAIFRKHADNANTQVRGIEKLKFFNKFELGGIDECYLDVSERCKNFREAEELAKKIKTELKEKEKLTCSVGIGPNKLIAKIAAGRLKPDGLTIIKPEQVKDFLKKLNVRELIGVGPKTEAVLNQMNIYTIGQLAKIPKEQLVDLFGKFGTILYDEARGVDESPVVEEWEAKSIGRQITFEKDTRDRKLILDTLTEIVKDTIKQLKAEKKKYKTITVKIRYEDFFTTSKAKTLKEVYDDEKTAQLVARELLAPFLEDEKKVRLIGFSVSKLE